MTQDTNYFQRPHVNGEVTFIDPEDFERAVKVVDHQKRKERSQKLTTAEELKIGLEALGYIGGGLPEAKSEKPVMAWAKLIYGEHVGWLWSNGKFSNKQDPDSYHFSPREIVEVRELVFKDLDWRAIEKEESKE